jgi:hypothetical protein
MEIDLLRMITGMIPANTIIRAELEASARRS